jgi:ureidoacrylate peracid hydrolase
MLQVLKAAREAKLRVFYALHRRYRPGDCETWKHIAPVQKVAWTNKAFEFGTWSGEMHPGFEPRPGEMEGTALVGKLSLFFKATLHFLVDVD